MVPLFAVMSLSSINAVLASAPARHRSSPMAQPFHDLHDPSMIHPFPETATTSPRLGPHAALQSSSPLTSSRPTTPVLHERHGSDPGLETAKYVADLPCASPRPNHLRGQLFGSSADLSAALAPNDQVYYSQHALLPNGHRTAHTAGGGPPVVNIGPPYPESPDFPRPYDRRDPHLYNVYQQPVTPGGHSVPVGGHWRLPPTQQDPHHGNNGPVHHHYYGSDPRGVTHNQLYAADGSMVIVHHWRSTAPDSHGELLIVNLAALSSLKASVSKQSFMAIASVSTLDLRAPQTESWAHRRRWRKRRWQTTFTIWLLRLVLKPPTLFGWCVLMQS